MNEQVFEYVLTVRQRTVQARWQYPDADGNKVDGETAEQAINADSLRMRTIGVLQSWLSRWGVLSRLQDTYAGLPVPNTSKVLGEHLYGLVFTDAVANAFDVVFAAAQARKETLRVVLSFELLGTQGADEIAGYPWEFLYRPGPDGFFIAAQTKFVLSREVMGRGRRTMAEDPPPLRVWFLVLTPEFEGFEEEHKELVMTFGEIEDFSGALRPRAILRWDEEKIRKELKETKNPPHIIHVVAVCRSAANGSGGTFEIAFQNDQGRAVWQDQDTLVGLLESAIQDTWTPRLVVLHLCETTAVDYLATFGHLAPKLIRAQFPAVLAMQYPLPATEAKRFTSSFYKLLAEGRPIGDAVQGAREEFHQVGDANRLFGAPVLYLQADDGRLVRTGNAGPSVPPRHDAPAAPRGREGLIDALFRTAYVGAPAQEIGERLSAQVRAQEWPENVDLWDGVIRLWWFAEPDLQKVQDVYRKMLELVARESGGRP
ncbi:CHAT domain-containing protein [Actinoplanes sp. M2I2]|uniref:CHAT domain-containing protein n=1 Tax=Actinoplanes sp. M2I2 TaxID=1734444 RepID=UPI0020219A90|nr:CHAT domain-containing protein [Actinoplanes sp. M2I2]